MEHDSLGLLFIGLAVALLIFILFGHKRREHMSGDTSAWYTIRKEVEEELSKNFDFNVAKLRYATNDQNAFFKDKEIVNALNEIRRVAFFADLSPPDVKDVKNTDKMFDEKMVMLKKQYDDAVKGANGGGKDNTVEGILVSILVREHLKMGILHMKNMAKMWMFMKANEQDKNFLKLKSTADKISTSVSSSISKIIG